MSPFQRCCSPAPTEEGHKTLPLATADWIREGHLTQLDQSNALPETEPWDTLVVVGSLRWLPEYLVPGMV